MVLLARLQFILLFVGYISLHTGLDKDRTTGMDPSTTCGAAYGQNQFLK
jgi:hypothetical protein